MRKTIAAVSVGLLLVAGQAAAAGSNTAVRVGDRVGASADGANEFAGIPVIPFIVAIVGIAALVAVASEDEPESN